MALCSPVSQQAHVMFQIGTPMHHFPMRWDVRNTFLEFYDDDEKTFGSKCRATSSPAALMTKAWKQVQKPVTVRYETVAKTQKDDMDVPAVGPPKRGGGMRRVAVRQAPVQPAMTAEPTGIMAPFGEMPGAQSTQQFGREPILESDPTMDSAVDFAAVPGTEMPMEMKTKRPRRRCKTRPVMASNTSAEFPASEEGQDESVEDRAVTLMIRHVACCYSQQQVMEILDNLGLKEKYNFVHVPLNSKKTANLGYFFVNFAGPDQAEDCRAKVEGRVFGPSRTTKKCDVAIAHMQGRAHFARLYAPQVSEEAHMEHA